jgi:hypothetical protein
MPIDRREGSLNQVDGSRQHKCHSYTDRVQSNYAEKLATPIPLLSQMTTIHLPLYQQSKWKGAKEV